MLTALGKALAVGAALCVAAPLPAAENLNAPGQARMLDEIATDFRQTAFLTRLKAMSPRVRDAMARVPRHRFVGDGDQARAYVNRPLSIGHGQTISQPFIVALMTELCDLDAESSVLEIGTGSGYQAAVLGEVAGNVYSIEIIPQLAERARLTLGELGYSNVEVRTGDGNLGWPQAAPFDAIMVTAAGPVPPALLAQLKPGRPLVIPIDKGPGDQVLSIVTVDDEGRPTTREILPVRFVPLTGDIATR